MLKIAGSLGLVLALVVCYASEAEEGLIRLRSLDAALGACAILAMFFSFSVLSALRWMGVVAALGGRLSFSRAVQGAMVGAFFYQTPLSVIGGDAARAWYGARSGLDLSTALTSVVLDRLIGVGTLILLMAASLPWTLHLLEGTVSVWTLLLAVPALLALFFMASRLSAPSGRGPMWSAIGRIASECRAFAQRPLRILPTALLCVLSHCLAGVIVFLIALAIGVDVGIFDAVVLMQPVMLLSWLPISVAGWGVREGAMVVAFGHIGVDSGAALAISVIFGLVGLVASLPGWIVWLLHERPGGKCGSE